MSKNNNDKWYWYTNQDVIIERLMCVIRGFHSPYNTIKALWLMRLLSWRNTRDRNSLAFAGGSTGAEVRAVTAWVPSQQQEKYQSQSGDTNTVNNVFYGFGHYSFKSMNVWLKKQLYFHQSPFSCSRGRYGNDSILLFWTLLFEVYKLARWKETLFPPASDLVP